MRTQSCFGLGGRQHAAPVHHHRQVALHMSCAPSPLGSVPGALGLPFRANLNRSRWSLRLSRERRWSAPPAPSTGESEGLGAAAWFGNCFAAAWSTQITAVFTGTTAASCRLVACSGRAQHRSTIVILGAASKSGAGRRRRLCACARCRLPLACCLALYWLQGVLLNQEPGGMQVRNHQGEHV